jgi:hypothetical protein
MQPLSQAGRTSVPQLWLLHNDVLALDPTESTQALLPRFDEIWGRSSHADSSNGWRRLRLGAKRRGEEAAAQGAKEGVLSRCRLQNHVAAARELGRVLAQRQLGVVYGGARVGLMGALADAALSGGGHVIGVMPEALVAKEVAHRGLSELRVVKSIHERKAIQGRPLPMYPCPAARVRPGGGGALPGVPRRASPARRLAGLPGDELCEVGAGTARR